MVANTFKCGIQRPRRRIDSRICEPVSRGVQVRSSRRITRRYRTALALLPAALGEVAGNHIQRELGHDRRGPLRTRSCPKDSSGPALSACRLHALHTVGSDCSGVIGPRLHVQPVPGLQLEVPFPGVEHDAAGHAVEYLVVGVRVPPVLVSRRVSTPPIGESRWLIADSSNYGVRDAEEARERRSCGPITTSFAETTPCGSERTCAGAPGRRARPSR